MVPKLSLIHGPKEPEIWSNKTLCDIIDEQTNRYADRPMLIVPWQSTRLSYHDLAERSKTVAKAMLHFGLRHGDCIGIMDGNSCEYIEVFLGAARIGCPAVVLNNTYTPDELKNAVYQSSCKTVFITPGIGTRSLIGHIKLLQSAKQRGPDLRDLQQVVYLRGNVGGLAGGMIQSYTSFIAQGHSRDKDTLLEQATKMLAPEDVLNLQFTSGTTGNILNNARFVGDAMRLTPDDIVCCGPPLFHCFGLVLGFLASFCYGSSIVFPSDYFRASSVVDALLNENPTVLLGVPTMLVAELEVLSKTGQKPRRLRTGLASGSAVSQVLMNEIRERMGVDKMLIAYGMTETSPVSFITSLDDPDQKRISTIGRVMPHTSAKVIDKEGNILPRGQRGELCISGYALQKGYWKNEEKTREVMRQDENGVLWMYTGDEVMIDEAGYAHITGRIKDLIIRGGENIFPREIEDRLASHPNITEASVVGIRDERYGEVVGCFLKAAMCCHKIPDNEIRKWVERKLGRHKSPSYVFWIGDTGVGNDFPKTGSGKHQKHILRDIGNRLAGHTKTRARL
ncbi:hypothetical protein P175DRAFT_0559879 [Aspergillus ochraceoroseus IBT 24754]|uniref:AMP-dependent synthetase/ligase domain-containing protein n=2 Tax=Aspergillus ochraceoroseus TaxID=138278 RepID=A0A2T5LNV2_9EURO|nr:uncharacterized protein P175DRAFT_0559879 [Aspergillus ochraceoroseus IBT 24754]KKK15418.1 hypothetical protein AOCH_001155 [Aspergillus ochraceoroseus]PTU17970.1 hypothetical protein P175DRAFT_0559879 [Aspergillus ochraceoroseus IBT 24754]